MLAHQKRISLECGGKRDTALDYLSSKPKRRRRYALPAHSKQKTRTTCSLEAMVRAW